MGTPYPVHLINATEVGRSEDTFTDVPFGVRGRAENNSFDAGELGDARGHQDGARVGCSSSWDIATYRLDWLRRASYHEPVRNIGVREAPKKLPLGPPYSSKGEPHAIREFPVYPSGCLFDL